MYHFVRSESATRFLIHVIDCLSLQCYPISFRCSRRFCERILRVPYNGFSVSFADLKRVISSTSYPSRWFWFCRVCCRALKALRCNHSSMSRVLSQLKQTVNYCTTATFVSSTISPSRDTNISSNETCRAEWSLLCAGTAT